MACINLVYWTNGTFIPLAQCFHQSENFTTDNYPVGAWLKHVHTVSTRRKKYQKEKNWQWRGGGDKIHTAFAKQYFYSNPELHLCEHILLLLLWLWSLSWKLIRLSYLRIATPACNYNSIAHFRFSCVCIETPGVLFDFVCVLLLENVVEYSA